MSGGPGIDVVVANGNYAINIDYSEFLPPVSVTDPVNQDVLLWNPITLQYVLVPVAGLFSAGVLSSGQGGIGYTTGAGGVVTQITSRTTGVTLNTVSGAITLFAAAPVVGTWFSFTVTDASVAATDTVSLSVQSATNTYQAAVTAVAAGSFRISMVSVVGTASDSPVVNFNVIKGSAT